MELRHSPLLRRLIFSSGIRLAGVAVSTVAGLIVSPYMLSKLGANDCGLFSIVAALITLLSFLEAGLQSAINRHLAAAVGLKDDNALNKYFNSSFFLYTCVAAAVAAAACLLAFNIETFINTSGKITNWFGIETSEHFNETVQRNVSLTQIILVLSAVNFGVMLIPRIQSGVIAAALRDDILSAINLIFKIFRPLTILGVLFFGGHLVALSVSFIVLSASFLPVWQFFVQRLVPQLRFSFRFVQWNTIKELYQFGFFAFAAFASSSMTMAFSFLFITLFLGLESVAVYNMVCITLFCAGKDVVITLTNYLSPLFAQLGILNEKDKMLKTLFFSLKVSTGVVLFIAFGFIAWGHPFILRWMSGHPEMLAAYPPLVLLSVVLLLEQSQAPAVEFLYGTGTHKYYALLNSIEAATALFLLPVLTYKFQIIGTAASLLTASVIVRVMLQPYYVCKVLEFPCRRYYYWFLAVLSKGAAALILPAAATYFFVAPSFPKLFLTGSICTVLYAVVYVLLVFTKKERTMVWNAMYGKERLTAQKAEVH
jgi:O-antigen/teichoic acid export membrane protein